MLRKIPVFNCASVVFIYNDANLTEILIQQKDKGLPNIFGQNEALCPFGGNWFDPEAKKDLGPFDTLRREIIEELSFREGEGFSSDIAKKWNFVTEAILDGLRQYKTALVETSTSVLDMMPGNKKTGFITRVAYFTCILDEDVWKKLKQVQKAVGNLSNEGASRILTNQEIVENKMRVAFGHDQMLKRFLLEKNCCVEDMEMYPNPVIQEIDWLDTYNEILEQFEIEKTPHN